MHKITIFALAALAAPMAHATIPFTVSLESEKPGIQNSQSKFAAVGIETFDALHDRNGQNFVSDFGGSVFSGTYSGVDIKSADQYGGAGGTGKYAVTFASTGYTSSH